MSHNPTNETTPDQLLTSFAGRSLRSIIIFTVIAHVLFLLLTSGPYIWRAVAGGDSSGLSESERTELAVKEASAALRQIAEEHGVKPQDLSSRFTANAPAPAANPGVAPVAPEPAAPAETPPPGTEEPESAIEKEIKKAEPGPTVPDTDEDLFK